MIGRLFDALGIAGGWGFLAYLVMNGITGRRQVRSLLDKWVMCFVALEERRVEVAERDIQLREEVQRGVKATADSVRPPAPLPMPQALRDRIEMWEEPFAQDEERRTILALYAELGDWDKVAQALPTFVVAGEGVLQ